MQEPSSLPPGEYIKKALQERGWTQADLALIVGKHTPAINQVVQGKRSISPEMAIALGAAFGTGPEIWMERESRFRLSLISGSPSQIAHRAKLFKIAPVKEMEKRGWIQSTRSPDDLERELCRFFEVSSLDEEPRFSAFARQSDKSAPLTAAQKAWCMRSARLARVLKAEPFAASKLEAGLSEVRKLADFPEKAKHLPKVLSEIGIRLLVVEHLPHTRIDGAAFWLSEEAPVIVLSMRHDRIDSFWFTLAHELMHIRHKDAQSVDSDLFEDSRQEPQRSQVEARADKEASELLIPEAEIRSFILRVKPLYSKARINQFAMRVRVHPGIVTGQLQHQGEITFGTNREMLVKVRDFLIKTALTDGWGKVAPAV